jgi:S1-C subfamily serine protease
MNVSRWRAPIAVVAATAVLGAAGFLFGPAAHRPIEAQWEEGGQAVAPVRTSSSGPDFASLAAAVTPAVVRVETTKQMTEAANMRGAPDDVIPEPFRRFFDMPNQMPDSRGTEPPVALAGGSGFLISSDGYIVTNNHVVEDAQGVRVWLHDGRSYQADIVGTDPTTDVAVIRIHQDHLPFLAWGNSDALRVGDWVMAVGNPGVEGSAPLDYTVTSGIVSAKGRPLGIIRNSLDESGAGTRSRTSSRRTRSSIRATRVARWWTPTDTSWASTRRSCRRVDTSRATASRSPRTSPSTWRVTSSTTVT